MLIERGAIVQEGTRWVATADVASIEIPETLHGLLLARIDQLPDDAKRSLRVAAVIGRQFPVRVLEHVIGADP
jgi:predicted ATPase